jgi:hypothetical protein
MEWTDSALRDYLLGSSSPEAAERIEARVIEDDQLFAALRSAEDDLFDACARGRLAPAERARFLERYGQHADRLQFAAALAHRTAGTSSSGSRRTWISLAAAAVLVLAAGALFTQLEAPAPVVVRQAPTATVEPQPFAVALTLGTSRAVSAVTPVTIPSGTTAVQLTVRLDPGDRFDKYAIELRGAGDRVVWSGGDLTPATVDGNLTVSARIPATALPGGSYELAVRGAGTDLGFLPLTIRWSP